MQMLCTHKNKSDNRMIGIPVYIVLLDKTGELVTKPLRIEQNISRRREVSSPKKSPLYVSEVLIYCYQNAPEGTRTECSQRNQNRMPPKELEQNVPEGTRT